MRRAQFCALTLMGLCLMLSAASTEARELQFLVENRIGGDDNIFLVAQDSDRSKTDDGYWSLVPGVILSETDKKELSYDFRYRPSYEKYFTTSDVDGFDHRASGRLDWQATPADFVGIQGDFARTRRLRQGLNADAFDPDAALEGSDRLKIQRSRASFFYQRQLTPRFSGRVDYGFDDLDYSRRAITDSRAHTIAGGVNYAVDPLTSVGATVTGRLRNSKFTREALFGIEDEIRSTSRTVDLSLSLRRQLTPTFDVSVQAGPSFIRTKQDRQVGALGTESGSRDVSVFAAAAANKRWKRVILSVVYTRFESGGAGVAASTIVDDVTATVVYRPDPSWRLALTGGWNLRDEIADDVEVGGDTKFERWRISGTVSKRLSYNLNLIGRVQYRSQDRQSRNVNVSDLTTESLSGWVGVQYRFDPIVF